MFEFKSGVKVEEYRAFLKTCHYNAMQDPAWGSIKTEWQNDIVALYRDGVMVGGALLLIRRLMPGMKLIYAPRGFTMDYSDKEAVRAFTDGIRGYAKEIGAYMVRIDPEIRLSERYKDVTTPLEKGAEELKNLTDVGFKHMGYAKDFHTYTQPRYYAEKSLYQDGKPMTDDELLMSYGRKARKTIHHDPATIGLHVDREATDEAVSAFTRLSEHTEARQHIMLRNEAYFKRLHEAYGENCDFFFARVNLNAIEASLKAKGDEHAQEQLARIPAIREQYGDEVTLSALLLLRSGDTAYLMYSGFDDGIFPELRTTTSIRYEAMKYYRDHGIKVFNFMGIHGDLNDSLAEFKLKFNPTVVEFAGEFELPVRKLSYGFMRIFFPIAHRIYIRISLLLKR